MSNNEMSVNYLGRHNHGDQSPTNNFCTNAALLYPGHALTVQAHPEFRPEFVDGLMKTRGKGLVPDDVMAAAAERLEDDLADRTIARQIAAFFKNPNSQASPGA